MVKYHFIYLLYLERDYDTFLMSRMVILFFVKVHFKYLLCVNEKYL